MILLVHMIFGVAMGFLFRNPILGVVVAFLSHYFLDLFPHIEYDIDDIKNLLAQAGKNWRKVAPSIFRVFFDFITGLILIAGLSSGQPIIFVYAFFAILPDGISFFLRDDFHLEKIHFLKHNKKISTFWRIFSQVLVVIISILILNFIG